MIGPIETGIRPRGRPAGLIRHRLMELERDTSFLVATMQLRDVARTIARSLGLTIRTEKERGGWRIFLEEKS